jgi:DNA-binding transcriptional regulator LsrR (DeoR family)
MRQVREVLRLKYACGHSERRIAAALGISRYTVAEYLRRAAVIGLTWPVPPELDDAALERKLFTPPGFTGIRGHWTHAPESMSWFKGL